MPATIALRDRSPAAGIVQRVETAAAPLIEADGVGKRYGSVTALDDVSLSVDARAVGLLGANGAGKSTLMKLMLGLIRPDSGSVRVLGGDATAQSWDARRRLGYMPEHSCLPMGMTARDLVVHMGELRGLPRRVSVLRASEVLFQVGLEEERSRLIRTFSVGMRQRTNLAQAIVHSPELVILDEPTNGLDPAGREEMLQLVRRLSADLGIAVVMSSHVLEDVARTCDTVVVLREGTLAAVQAVERPDEHEARELRVRVSGDTQAFVGELERRGVQVRPGEDDLVVSGPGREQLLDAVRDAAVAAGVGLRQLTSAGPTLEDALIGAMS
jgi:ABC-2 type transport system ATP-binding protein